jgi:hypothetical protein
MTKYPAASQYSWTPCSTWEWNGCRKSRLLRMNDKTAEEFLAKLLALAFGR